MNKDQFKKVLSKTIEIKDGGEAAIAKEIINLEDKVQEVDLKIDNSIDGVRKDLETIKLDEEKVVEKIIANIPEPIKGDKGEPGDSIKGDSYILTSKDKQEIAKSIKVPIVDKVIEKTEVIIEKPIVKEVAIAEDRQKIVEKINTGKKDDVKIKTEQIEGIEKLTTKENLDRAVSILDQRTQFLINKNPKAETDPIWTADKQEIEFGIEHKIGDDIYYEPTITDGNVTQVDYYTDSGKGTKLFTKVITYTSDKPTSIVMTDEVTSKVLTTTITYSGDDVATVTKALT
jgi:hypothetical protein